MMDFQKLIATATELLNEASFISEIKSEEDYNRALELMDSLIDDYDNQKLLIEILSHSIEKWEETAEEFASFNANLESIDTDVAVLKVLIEQYNLKAADLEKEIGSKSLVSMILNGTRSLTTRHIKALSKRFHINPAVFLH